MHARRRFDCCCSSLRAAPPLVLCPVGVTGAEAEAVDAGLRFVGDDGGGGGSFLTGLVGSALSTAAAALLLLLLRGGEFGCEGCLDEL